MPYSTFYVPCNRCNVPVPEGEHCGTTDYLCPDCYGLRERFDIYLEHADDGSGGDITNHGQPLKTFDEWLNS